MNLSKISRAFPRLLYCSARRSFGGGGGGHDEGRAHLNDPSEITDEQYAKYDFLFPGPTKSESRFAYHNIVSKFFLTKSRGFLQFFAENFQETKAESEVERFIPPKVHENSVFLYQSKELANSVRKLRALEWVGLFFFGAVMHQPLFAVPTFAAFYYIYGNAFFYELSRRLVTRMDLLPHLEMIQVQRVGFLGTVYSRLFHVDDLEKVDYEEELQDKENYFWGLNKTNVDPYLIFRVKSTGELLCFDRDGYWDWEGISHELLN